ncbi:MAG TPA: hypothetical protein VMS71_02305 [Candidatus Acidoferrum sp.]|nr:hypothetical protein [Candidatus Acidoferrum sp.]
MSRSLTISIVMALAALVAVGCQKSPAPTQNADMSDPQLIDPDVAACPIIATPPPSPLVTVSIGTKQLQFWPYLGTNFSGAPQDPINLIFVGKADPRDIRAALMSLPGDRTALGFPASAPFNMQWTDAIGDVETDYGKPDGWTGSVIQLACGDYGPMRFHLRLCKQGEWTIANAHLDLLIPGTTDHQVISWEFAKQFVIADFMRSGLLDAAVPMMPTAQITPSPFRTIPAIIYNGMPVELRVMIGGPAGDVTTDVPILSDGAAMILNLAKSVARQYGESVQDFDINFDQVIPKPFCDDSHSTYLYAKGTVHLRQRAGLNRNGWYTVNFLATGQLVVVPVNPLTGEPVGTPLDAEVYERHLGSMSDRMFDVSSSKYQRLGTLDDVGGGSMAVRLRVTSGHQNVYVEKVSCSEAVAAGMTSK